MSETERLYYKKSGLVRTEARVVSARSAEGFTDLVLDSTIFYPEGGGQPCDLGTIAGHPVLSVIEDAGRIIHRLQGEVDMAEGSRVELVLDVKRRRDHSQQHSAQHLISAILEREFCVHTLSFHLGTAYSTIDISCPEPDSRTLAAIENMAEDFIAHGRPFRICVCPPEDAASFDLRKKPPEGEVELRIVEIDDYDWVACCGTHVSSCSELRLLKILSTERYKGNTRLYFVAGDRAVAYLKSGFSSLKVIAGILGSSTEEASARVEALAKGLKLKESELENSIRDRARVEVDLALSGSVRDVQKPGCLSFSYDDRGAGEAFETAKAGAVKGFPVIVLSTLDRTVGVVFPPALAASRSLPPLGIALKPLLSASGARGGGGPNTFRASFASIQDAKDFADAALRLFE